jgi:hypothetical protein
MSLSHSGILLEIVKISNIPILLCPHIKRDVYTNEPLFVYTNLLVCRWESVREINPLILPKVENGLHYFNTFTLSANFFLSLIRPAKYDFQSG